MKRGLLNGSADVDNPDIDDLIDDWSIVPLDPGRAPITRAAVVSGAGNTHLLLLLLSHMVCDGWSVSIFWREIEDIYTAALAGRAPRLQEVGMQHSQFAAEEHAAVDHGLFTDSVAYWSRQWAQLGPALVRHRELPCACHGASPLVPPAIRSERVALGAIIANALTQMCRTRNLTTFAVFRCAVAIVFHHLTSKGQVALWSNFLNRPSVSSQRMIGWCSNAHALMTDIGAARTCDHLARQIAAQMSQAHQHQRLSLPALWQILGRCLEGGDTRIVCDVQGRFRAGGQGIMVPIGWARGREWTDLDVRLHETDAEVVVTYDSNRYDATGVAAMARAIHHTLAAMTADMDSPIDRTREAIDAVSA